MGSGSIQNVELVKQKLDSGCFLPVPEKAAWATAPSMLCFSKWKTPNHRMLPGSSANSISTAPPLCCVTLSKVLNLPVALWQNGNNHCTSLLGFSGCKGLYRQIARQAFHCHPLLIDTGVVSQRGKAPFQHRWERTLDSNPADPSHVCFSSTLTQGHL